MKMSELISKEQVIRLIESKLIDGHLAIGDKPLIDAHELINDVSDMKEDGWIPVSYRLPNEQERRKAYCRDQHGSQFIVMIVGATQPTTLYINSNNVWFDEEKELYRIAAWQPLPEPYKESEEQ